MHLCIASFERGLKRNLKPHQSAAPLHESRVLAKLALQNAPGGGTAQGFVGCIDLRQQLDIGSRVAAGEAMAATGLHPYLPRGHVAAH